MKNILSLNISPSSLLRRQLDMLYYEIGKDNFESIGCDITKMACYGVRQGQFFKLYREFCHFSREELAKATELSIEAIYHIENGSYVPDEHITKRYAYALGAVEEMGKFLDCFENHI
jgi:DNA-binding XRE family transcriptional regulator